MEFMVLGGVVIQKLHCDNAQEFISDSCWKLFERYGIDVENGATYTPSHQGMIERQHSMIKRLVGGLLSELRDEKSDWMPNINAILLMVMFDLL